MCGIVGTVDSKDLRSFLLNGLKSLEYRGYDSAGIATITDSNFNLYRCVGRVEELEKRFLQIYLDLLVLVILDGRHMVSHLKEIVIHMLVTTIYLLLFIMV